MQIAKPVPGKNQTPYYQVDLTAAGAFSASSCPHTGQPIAIDPKKRNYKFQFEFE